MDSGGYVRRNGLRSRCPRTVDIVENMFIIHGLRVIFEKAEIMWVGQNKYMDLHPDGKKLKQRESFVYLGGAIHRDGNSETEIGRRI